MLVVTVVTVLVVAAVDRVERDRVERDMVVGVNFNFGRQRDNRPCEVKETVGPTTNDGS